VVTCAVAWEPLAAAGIPLPPRLGSRPPFALFGRGAEAETLALAWAKARDGQRQVVLLAGEPIGWRAQRRVEMRCAASGRGCPCLASLSFLLGTVYEDDTRPKCRGGESNPYTLAGCGF
jgi:hypothetical protein